MIEHEGMLLNPFYKTSIILMPKPEKDTTSQENKCQYTWYKSSQWNTRILNSVAHIILHKQDAVIPGVQGWFNVHKSMWYINKVKQKIRWSPQ